MSACIGQLPVAYAVSDTQASSVRYAASISCPVLNLSGSLAGHIAKGPSMFHELPFDFHFFLCSP